MKKILFVNRKGGVGKTFLATNYAVYLANQNKKVLLIDMDFQGNSSKVFGIDNNNHNKKTFEDFLLSNNPLKDSIHKSVFKNVDLISSSTNIMNLDKNLSKKKINLNENLFLFQKELSKFRKYDYVIFDVPALFHTGAIISFIISDLIIAPTLLDSLSIEGLSFLKQQLSSIDKKIDLVVPNRIKTISKRTNTNFIKKIENIGLKLSKQYISESVIVSQNEDPILLVKPKHKVSQELIKIFKKL